MRSLVLIYVLALLNACANVPQVSDAVIAPSAKAVESRIVMSKDLSDISDLLVAADQRTLLVLDIDDTLLTSATFFGSDHWYEWQKSLAPDHPALVACRFDVIAMNYELGTQKLTQANGPELVNSVPVDRLMLTARNPAYRNGTLRELQKAGYTLPDNLEGLGGGANFVWKPNSDSSPVRVDYQQGVFMVSGQNKGLLLLDLLKRAAHSYDRVILVDDGEKNILNMQAALKAAEVNFIGVHYLRVDKHRAATASEVSQALKAWIDLQQFLQVTFPERLERIQAGDCHL